MEIAVECRQNPRGPYSRFCGCLWIALTPLILLVPPKTAFVCFGNIVSASQVYLSFFPSSSHDFFSSLPSGCGYGCQLHHAVYCLVVAFASRRTLILESLGWRYHPDGGWDSVFQPISKTCLISNAALLALEKRANDSTAIFDSRGDSTKSRRGEKR